LDSNSSHPLVIFAKLFMALICGGIIGFERGRHNQPAGLRTHIIISLGACLVMILSIFMGEQYMADRARIAAQVVSGIGFLGGAAIIRFKFAIKGVTTMATIWTTAGIGLTIGGGLYLASIFASGLVMFTLMVLNIWEKKVVKTTSLSKLQIQARRNIDLIPQIFTVMKSYKIKIGNFGLTEDIAGDNLDINFTIRIPTQIDVNSLFYDISTMEGVVKIHLE